MVTFWSGAILQNPTSNTYQNTSLPINALLDQFRNAKAEKIRECHFLTWIKANSMLFQLDILCVYFTLATDIFHISYRYKFEN